MAEERYPSRVRTQVWKPAQLVAQAESLLKLGYQSFKATEGSGGNGDEDCQATLWFEIGYSQSVHEQGRVEGDTKNKRGHAEMDALHQFWVGKCGKDLKVFVGAFTKGIQCEAKPCCVRCSAVLGLLGISAISSATKKSSATAGKTQWAITEEVRELLGQVCAVPAAVFESFGSVKYS